MEAISTIKSKNDTQNARKHYIDNLRWLAILLLFPFHAAQLWCGDGSAPVFYVWSHVSMPLQVFSTAVYPWFMTLLFTIAGMSAKYALRRRTDRQFLAERAKKLLVPFVFGTLVLAPVMTYVANVFFFDYKGTYLQQYGIFFTKFTDLTGYDGGFTPGHYWFLLYLFVISAFALLVVKVQKKLTPDLRAKSLPFGVLLLMFVPEWLCLYVANISGKSLGQFAFLFLLGYYVLSEDAAQEKIKRHRFISLALWLTSGVLYVYLYCFRGVQSELITGLYVLYGWTGILTLLGVGQKCLDFRSGLTDHMSRASFPIYILHMPVLTVVGFFVLKMQLGTAAQFTLVMLLSFVLTLALYELVRRVPVLRTMIGIGKSRKKTPAEEK